MKDDREVILTRIIKRIKKEQEYPNMFIRDRAEAIDRCIQIVKDEMEWMKACPFCGFRANVEKDRDGYLARCANKYCLIMPCTHVYRDRQDAVKAWNKRAGWTKWSQREIITKDEIEEELEMENPISPKESVSLNQLKEHAKEDLKARVSQSSALNGAGARVMGWHITFDENHYGNIPFYVPYWTDSEERRVIARKDWNPCKNPVHWGKVVDEILKQHEAWNFTLELDCESCSALFYESAEGMVCHGSGEAPLGQKGLAIMRAVEEATTEEQQHSMSKGRIK